jgi:hypothetical protein
VLGQPIVVFATFPSFSDHRYRYARWTGTQWISHEVADAGTAIADGREPFYSGGIVIDPDDTRIVYYSRVKDGVHQIFKGFTGDGGETFAETQLTFGTEKCFRPYKPKRSTKLLYLCGPYVHWTEFEGVSITSLDLN